MSGRDAPSTPHVATPRAHWMAHARRWNLVGTPLRPPAEDVARCRDAVAGWHARSGVREPRALVLGVTPELIAMPWPAGTRVLAVDQALAMVHAIWPGPRDGHAAACADWLRLPLAPSSQHLIVGDGSYNALPGGGAYAALTASLRRAIRDDGLLVLRFFVRPEAAEPVDAVLADLLAGRTGSLHVFKWRLAMALHGSLAEGVRLDDIWQAWHDGVPDPAALMERLGWAPELLETIDGYRGVDTCYTFPTLAEARGALAPAFEECEVHTPGYELGARCPTLVLSPRRSP